MKDYKKNMRLALVCFLLVVVLNFFLPRLLPGNPVAYLTGFSEQPAMDLSRDKNAEEMKWSPLEMGAAMQAHGA